MSEINPRSRDEVNTHLDLMGHKLDLEALREAQKKGIALYQARLLLLISHPEAGEYIKAAHKDIEVHAVPTPQKNYSRVRYSNIEDPTETTHIFHVGLNGHISYTASKTDKVTGAKVSILEGWLMPLVDTIRLDEITCSGQDANASEDQLNQAQ